MTPNTLNINKAMFKKMRRAISIAVLAAFISTSVKSPAYAQVASNEMPWMPKPGVMVHLSPEFTPAYLKGIVIHPENALKFDFIIYKGDKELTDGQKREEYNKLTKYFLASLAIPDDDQWVNLSPYEKDRIIKDDFGKTEMGRDLLAQDYVLKQITASLIYPGDNLGKKFWDKVYSEAQEQYGTSNIPVNTFNKVWILPDDALIYEKGNTAYVLKNHLKVMLEEDYLSLKKHSGIQSAPMDNKTHSIASKIVKEIVLPELEREVNEGKNFAAVRQVYSGMLLAAWYKRALKESLLSRIYANKAKVKGVDQDPRTNEEIYRQYLRAYKKGVFNFIKEDVDKYTNETIPRKYFSGGAVDYAMAFRELGHDPLKTIDSMTSAQVNTVQDEGNKEDYAQVVTEESKVAAIADAAQQSAVVSPTGWRFPTRQPIDIVDQQNRRKSFTFSSFSGGVYTDRPGHWSSLKDIDGESTLVGLDGATFKVKATFSKDGNTVLIQNVNPNIPFTVEGEEVGSVWQIEAGQPVNFIDQQGQSKSFSFSDFAGGIYTDEQGNSHPINDPENPEGTKDTITLPGGIKIKVTFPGNGEKVLIENIDTYNPFTIEAISDAAMNAKVTRLVNMRPDFKLYPVSSDILKKDKIKAGIQSLLNELYDVESSIINEIPSTLRIAGLTESAKSIEESRVMKISGGKLDVIQGAIRVLEQMPQVQDESGDAAMNAQVQMDMEKLMPAMRSMKGVLVGPSKYMPGATRVVGQAVVDGVDSIIFLNDAGKQIIITHKVGDIARTTRLVADENLSQMEEIRAILGLDKVQRKSGANEAMVSPELAFITSYNYSEAKDLLIKALQREGREDDIKNLRSVTQNISSLANFIDGLTRKITTKSDLWKELVKISDGLRAYEAKYVNSRLPLVKPRGIENVDKAALSKYGGIDFNAANLSLQIKRDGKGVALPISQQDLDNIHIDGLVPIIIDIKPATSLPIFSELQSTAAA